MPLLLDGEIDIAVTVGYLSAPVSDDRVVRDPLYTDPEHIEKWFTRNCKWTLGRECTPQEKGDFLLMIRSK